MITLHRAQLHADVWRKPIGHLAREMDVTSAKLREACKAMAIPLPSVGHWASVKAGTAPPAPFLEQHDGAHEYSIGRRRIR